MLPAGNCPSTPCTVWFRSMAPPSSQRTTKEEQRLQKPGDMMPSTQRPLLQRSTRQPHAFLTTTSRSPSCNDRQNSMSGRILPGCKLRWMSMQPCLMPSLFPTEPCAWRTFRKVSTEAARLQTAHGEQAGVHSRKTWPVGLEWPPTTTQSPLGYDGIQCAQAEVERALWARLPATCRQGNVFHSGSTMYGPLAQAHRMLAVRACVLKCGGLRQLWAPEVLAEGFAAQHVSS